jgi:dissimilatory sulfite reductase (desulfoviridin) alpha/beta subunit
MNFEACHCDLSNCPNPLLRVSEWREAVGQWVEACGLAEKVRDRVPGGKVRPHHDFRIVVAGCPNGCSRPQIADVGVVGMARPDFDLGACSGCGDCAEACPDGALEMRDGFPKFDESICQGCKKCMKACGEGCVTLSAPAVRALAGGKLGRRPRLGRVAAEFDEPGKLIGWLDRVVNDYFERARPDERFADFWARAGKE